MNKFYIKMILFLTICLADELAALSSNKSFLGKNKDEETTEKNLSEGIVHFILHHVCSENQRQIPK